jgi:hypothetical protein
MTKVTVPDDGGPAFPVSRETEGWYERGMTLRDWFAGQALMGMLAKQSNADGMHDSYASDAYRYADEMIRARRVGQEAA